MPQVTVRDKHQITLPMSIVREAHIRTNDVLSVDYKDGVITLATERAAQPQRKRLMDYAGIAKGLYGQTADEVHAYLDEERASWER
ncbi:AbrB/MazE/SpoVT family DNA-binding domain-containing protein [Ottowia testudinis]|uniref:AbrB/MazE/SpoVT family DNA-binding domain-containing protein n=1 Tax=Ottowia testudinis TaxID=2816950 RepID=A0A975CCK5_9BURK|nr:AbrB/MazE/SpoVT family DNA-binding domain-containing protein [Ottowia testudinis]QTD43795.1 AbrB/MazE/SpoVT family DNA-binding domain-containing protein [Ottowia testudinis]